MRLKRRPFTCCSDGALWLASGWLLNPSPSPPLPSPRHRNLTESADSDPAASYRANYQTKVSNVPPFLIVLSHIPYTSVRVTFWVAHRGPGKAPKMSQLKDRFVTLLHEKNFVTDQLATVEQKTGVKREYIALGESTTLRGRKGGHFSTVSPHARVCTFTRVSLAAVCSPRRANGS